MKDQHTLIKGYLDLTQEDIDKMNALKVKEQEVLAMLRDLMEAEEIDKRWVAIAKTHIEQGFMAAIRAIACPNE